MAIGIDDLDIEDYDEEVVTDNNPDPQNPPTEENPEEENLEENPPTQEESSLQVESMVTEEPVTENVDALQSYLQELGIKDMNKIKFENESGEITEVAWKDLPVEELLNILKSSSSNDSLLEDSEIDFINRLRLSNMTPEEYIAVIQQQAISEYLNNPDNKPLVHYTIDDLSDDELYVLDLQARVPEITDDELAAALDRAQSDEDLYKKEVAGLRQEYKRMEDEKNNRDQALLEQLQQQEFLEFASTIGNSINQFTNVGELDVTMDDSDKDELFNFITGRDLAGVSYLSKAFNDPDTLVKMAWFALHGEDIINSISDYYKNEISKAHKAGYDKGVNKAPKLQKAPESKVVIEKPKPGAGNQRKSIYDLHVD